MAYSRPIHLDILFDSLNRQPVHLLRTDRCSRIQLIHSFFPDLPVVIPVQDAGKKGEKTRALLEGIPEENRRFCSVCQYVDETFKNYLNYFFTAQREKSAFCRNLFADLFCGGSDPIGPMAEKCAAALRAAGLHDLPAEDRRIRELRTVLEKAMEELTSQLPELALPADLFRRDIQESLPEGLARVIASYAVYVDVSTFKNDRKRLEMLQQLKELLCAVWKIQPQDITWQLSAEEGIRAFHAGEYQRAQALFDEAQQLLLEEDRRSSYASAAYADLLSYQAHMLLDGSCGERSCAKAFQLIQTACRIKAPDGSDVKAPRRFYESAFFQIFHAEDWALHSGSDAGMGFLPLLERAAAEGCVDALVLLADLCLTGDHGCEAVKDPARGIALLEEAAVRTDLSPQERARCELRLAQHHLSASDPRQADLYYEKAARLGSYHALNYLREKNFVPKIHLSVIIPAKADGRICFFGPACEGAPAAEALRASLSADWVQRSGDVSSLLREQPELLGHGQLLFAFLSDDERQNLSGLLETLKLLNAVAYRQEENARLLLTDRTDLFVLVRSEASRMMIDAAMNHLSKDVYFRVHLCDPDLMAANELLQRCPTFLPCIDGEGRIRHEHWKHQKKNERCQRRIVLLGASRCVMTLARQIIACTSLEEYPTQLSIIGPDAHIMEERFREECPGVFTSSLTQHIVPQFFSCDLSALPVDRTGEGSTAQIHELLHEASYFAVAGDDDMENIALAVRLRTGLIRARLPQGLQPVIAVLYRDAATQWLASQIAVGAQELSGRYHWTENYGLFLFGSFSAFAYDRLTHSMLEQRALQIHKSYYQPADAAQERAVLGEYYRRSYNRDSSLCLAVSLVYHCFGMGVYHARTDSYLSPDGDALLGRGYRSALNEDTAEKAAAAEHARWNGWCLSRGWTKPGDDVLVAYMQMQNPRHHLEIGKLHPYITGYQQLVHEQQKLNELIATYQHTHRKLPDPRISDRELTQRIPDFLMLSAEACDIS